jgi:hypothetical protein
MLDSNYGNMLNEYVGSKKKKAKKQKKNSPWTGMNKKESC